MRTTPQKIVIIAISPVISSLLARFFNTNTNYIVEGVYHDDHTELADIITIQPDVIIMEMKSPIQNYLIKITELRIAFPWALIIVITNLDPTYYQELVINTGADSLVPAGELTTKLYPAIHKQLKSFKGIRNNESSLT